MEAFKLIAAGESAGQSTMTCPHCSIRCHVTGKNLFIGNDPDGDWMLFQTQCPSCSRFVLILAVGTWKKSGPHGPHFEEPPTTRLVHPRTINREPLSASVPKAFAEDFVEACLVLQDSPKASAALSRRCLQHLLREKANVKPGNLADEIQEALDSGEYPPHITDFLDAVRATGNFAAHPIKSQSTGEIIPVEPGEAELNLDVLEALFDFFFVQPEVIAQKREALNKKLADAGKPPLKQSTASP